MNEPAIDLGIVLAIASSKKDIIVREDTICFGEVGLSGEVRGVTMSEQRVAEAKKLGFKKCIVSPNVCLAGVSHIVELRLSVWQISKSDRGCQIVIVRIVYNKQTI